MTDAAGAAERSPAAGEGARLPEGPIVLFDGVCNLCAGAVRFIIPRDPRGRFRFASLQSEAGGRILAGLGVTPAEPGGSPESLVLVANRRAYLRSGAALRIAARLGGGWPVLAVLLVIPAPLRDLAYRFVARNRYRWFGRHTASERPRTADSRRFLDVEETRNTP